MTDEKKTDEQPTTPEIETPVAEQPPPIKIKAGSPYYYTVNRTDGEKHEGSCPRNLPTLLEALAGEDEDATVTVYLEKDDGEKIPMDPFRGTIKAVCMNIAQGCMTPNEAIQLFSRIISDVFGMSSVTGVMLTLISEEGAGGFTVLSNRAEADKEQIMQFAAAAAGQVAEFKDSARERFKVQFPDDNNLIVIPGRK